MSSSKIEVVQLSTESEYVKTWKSIREAERNLKIDRSSIIKVCKQKQKTAGGFKWIYKSEYTNKK